MKLKNSKMLNKFVERLLSPKDDNYKSYYLSELFKIENDDLLLLLTHLLKYDPSERCSTFDILNCDWLKNIDTNFYTIE